MRLFIAITITKEVRLELSKLQESLRQSNADVKWVEPDNIHLTLKFLGETSEEKLKEIKIALKEISKNHQAFFMHLSEIGVFPRPSFPRVVWVGVDEGKNQLCWLASDIESNFEKIGFTKEERPFSAHITLGRVRSPKNKECLIKEMEKHKAFASIAKALCDKIILFESKLTPNGPVYTSTEEFLLQR